jgi:hypothetical protein
MLRTVRNRIAGILLDWIVGINRFDGGVKWLFR